MTKCKSCGAGIIWAETPKGSRMPMDAEPVTSGFTIEKGKLVRVHLYESHFATCPNADKHRRKR